MSARLPITREDAVNGIDLNRPPILRMSCSLFRL